MSGIRELTPTPPHPERRQNERLAELERQVRTLNAQRPTGTELAQEPWHLIGATGEPAFGSGWSWAGSTYTKPGFFLDPQGLLHFKGTFQRSSAITTPDDLGRGGMFYSTLFTLPSGYRPSERNEIFVSAYNRSGNQVTAGVLIVRPGGNVDIEVFDSTTTAWYVWMDSVSLAVVVH